MKSEARAVFEEWYEEHKDNHFNFQEELERYCRMDVEILTKGCLKFRKLMMQVTLIIIMIIIGIIINQLQEHDVDPFTSSITIASTCMHIFRKKFLKPDTIGIVPHGGYRANERQSVIAIKWLKWISETQNADIQHARNGKEVGNFF